MRKLSKQLFCLIIISNYFKVMWIMFENVNCTFIFYNETMIKILIHK